MKKKPAARKRVTTADLAVKLDNLMSKMLELDDAQTARYTGLRADVSATRNELGELSTKYGELSGQLSAGYGELRGELSAGYGELRGELSAGYGELRGELSAGYGEQ